MAQRPVARLLEPPYRPFDPPAGQWVELPVLRWEVGLAQVPLRNEVGSIVKVALRFWVGAAGAAGTSWYLDMTHKLLVHRFLSAWRELVQETRDGDLRGRVLLAARLDPETPVPLRVRMTRRGEHPDSSYEVEIVRDWLAEG